MLQVGLGQPDIPGVTQVRARVALRHQPFHAGPAGVLVPELL